MRTVRTQEGAVWKRWMLVGMAVLVCPELACQSTGAAHAPRPAQEAMECPARLLAPQASLTYTLSCEGFTPKAQRLQAGAKVTFVSECDHPVTLGFSPPDTLFTSGVSGIVLRARGERKEETVGTVGGCHQACFGTLACPPPDDRDAKTGSLDVYTSGGTEPTPAAGT